MDVTVLTRKYPERNTSPCYFLHHNSHTDRPGIESAFYGKRRISTFITRVSQRSPSGTRKSQPTACQLVSLTTIWTLSFRQQLGLPSNPRNQVSRTETAIKQNKADSFHLPLPYRHILSLTAPTSFLLQNTFYINQRHSHVYEWETCFINFDVINLKTLPNKTASAKPVLSDMKFTSQFIQSFSHCWRARGTVCVTSSNKRTKHTNSLFNINKCR